MANINDVSRLAQVSKATVSRVLSGSRNVKEESRLAVMRAVEVLNYKPNVIAQSLSNQSTGCIGVVCASENINQTRLSSRAGKATAAQPKTSAAAFFQRCGECRAFPQ